VLSLGALHCISPSPPHMCFSYGWICAQSVRCVARAPAAASTATTAPSGEADGASVVLWTLDRRRYLAMESRHPQVPGFRGHSITGVATFFLASCVALSSAAHRCVAVCATIV